MPHEFEQDAAPHTAPTVSQTSAADQRVTPEELQAALRALEGRPPRPLPAAGVAPDTAHVPDTLSIGEAADALSLSIPPEELWREVQQQRAEKEHAQEQAGQQQKERTYTPPPFQQIPPLHVAPLRVAPPGVSQSRLFKRIVLSLTALAVSGWLFVGGHGTHPPVTTIVTSAKSGAMTLNDDGQTRTVQATGGPLVVNGDGNTLTITGTCDQLVVNGDTNMVRVRGSVQAVILSGDRNSVTYPKKSVPQQVVDNGSRNSARAE